MNGVYLEVYIPNSEEFFLTVGHVQYQGLLSESGVRFEFLIHGLGGAGRVWEGWELLIMMMYMIK